MRVAVKVYDKASLSPSKLRAVKREAAMMIMMQRKRYALRNALRTQSLATLQRPEHAGRSCLSSARARFVHSPAGVGPDIRRVLSPPAMRLRRMPLVTRFYGACQDRAHIYLVMELCPGGDLLELLLREGQVLSVNPFLELAESSKKVD